jgi:hypothetical protein
VAHQGVHREEIERRCVSEPWTAARQIRQTRTVGVDAAQPVDQEFRARCLAGKGIIERSDIATEFGTPVLKGRT